MLIGLHGMRRSGKDTAAAALVQDGMTAYALADPLREDLLLLDPLLPTGRRLSQVVDRVGWEGLKADPDDGPEARRLMQTYGTDVIRSRFGEDAWTRLGERMAAEHVDLVITDVRLPDEAEMVRRLGGRVIRVVRPGLVLDDAAGAHRTEAGLPDHLVDETVLNDADIPTLHARIRSAARR